MLSTFPSDLDLKFRCVVHPAGQASSSFKGHPTWGITSFTLDITLPTKVCLVKAMVFPVVMYGCESWTIRKAFGAPSGALKN